MEKICVAGDVKRYERNANINQAHSTETCECRAQRSVNIERNRSSSDAFHGCFISAHYASEAQLPSCANSTISAIIPNDEANTAKENYPTSYGKVRKKTEAACVRCRENEVNDDGSETRLGFAYE